MGSVVSGRESANVKWNTEKVEQRRDKQGGVSTDSQKGEWGDEINKYVMLGEKYMVTVWDTEPRNEVRGKSKTDT